MAQTIGELIKELQKGDATEPVLAIIWTRFAFEGASDIRNLTSQAEFAQIIDDFGGADGITDSFLDDAWSSINSTTRDVIQEAEDADTANQ